jgi:peptidoglycan hydrolase CwlO-like protein
MKKPVLQILSTFLLFGILFLTSEIFYLKPTFVHADELEDIAKKIEELTKAREMSISATAPLEAQLANLEKQIQDIINRLTNVQKRIEKKEEELVILEADIKKHEGELLLQKEIFGRTVRNFYIRSRLNVPFLAILSSSTAAQVTRELAYRNAVAREEKEVIIFLGGKILELKVNKEKARLLKEELTKEKGKLANLRLKIDKEAEFFRKEVREAKAYQQSLTIEIAKLTARQQEILGQKFGTFTTSVGDVPLPDDPNASPIFNPPFSPAFAAFSFGAFTHRKGMSQYGAWGRAKSGQDFNAILSKYYGVSAQKRDNLPRDINTDQGAKDFETNYLYGIAEMPSSWTENNSAALKAQAIAARTYALYYIGWPGGSRSICTSQACQVYLSSKASNPPEAWRKAVDETRGQVLIGQDGNPIGAFYSSTTGGYLITSGWDTTSSGRDTWTSGAYEKIAGSPWFYKGWYTKNYFLGSGTCGRSHPWLTQEELSDILNAWQVYQKGTDEDRKHISPVDTACWGGDPYSVAKMKERASESGGAYSSISSISVVYREDGQTASVTLSTNLGSLTISGADFKTIFNLRAPGYIAIRSPLFNIEKK